jgi:hypothetical protein
MCKGKDLYGYNDKDFEVLPDERNTVHCVVLDGVTYYVYFSSGALGYTFINIVRDTFSVYLCKKKFIMDPTIDFSQVFRGFTTKFVYKEYILNVHSNGFPFSLEYLISCIKKFTYELIYYGSNKVCIYSKLILVTTPSGLTYAHPGVVLCYHEIPIKDIWSGPVEHPLFSIVRKPKGDLALLYNKIYYTKEGDYYEDGKN